MIFLATLFRCQMKSSRGNSPVVARFDRVGTGRYPYSIHNSFKFAILLDYSVDFSTMTKTLVIKLPDELEQQ